ncbi:hypothetical protein AGMMS49938_06050 [Fibrobacterales bacterium]|nr:hypothetical protein AGMMS49938_06050 [Fibrobacterales bacterium]
MNKISYFHIPEHLDSGFTVEDWEIMKTFCIGYLLKNIEGVRAFAQKFRGDFGDVDFVFVLKMYVLNKNTMFNMQAYMQRQTKLAENFLAENMGEFDQTERRAMIIKWIEQNADAFRKLSIFRQISCIERMTQDIVPIVESALQTPTMVISEELSKTLFHKAKSSSETTASHLNLHKNTTTCPCRSAGSDDLLTSSSDPAMVISEELPKTLFHKTKSSSETTTSHLNLHKNTACPCRSAGSDDLLTSSSEPAITKPKSEF